MVMAHRDDIGLGPGADDNASGTAALIELARAYARPSARDPGRVGAHGRLPLDRRRRVRRSRRGAFPPHLALSEAHRRGDQPRCDRGLRAGEPRDRRRPAPLPNASLVATAIARVAEQTGEPPHARRLLRPTDRSRLPLHPLRAGPVRRPGHSGGDADHGRRPSAGRRSATTWRRSTRPGWASSAPPRSSCSARSTRGSSSRRARRATSCSGRPGDQGLGDRARARRAAPSLRGRDRRPVRALPPPPRRLRAGDGGAAKPAALLAVRADRFHVFSSPRRLADRARRGHPTREPRSPATGRRQRCSRCSRCSSSAGR